MASLKLVSLDIFFFLDRNIAKNNALQRALPPLTSTVAMLSTMEMRRLPV